MLCPTKRNFSFILSKEIVCNACKRASEVREVFRDLSLDILEVQELEAITKLY